MDPEILDSLMTNPAFVREVFARMTRLGQRWLALANMIGAIVHGLPLHVARHVPFVLGAVPELDDSAPALVPISSSVVHTRHVLALMRILDAVRMDPGAHVAAADIAQALGIDPGGADAQLQSLEHEFLTVAAEVQARIQPRVVAP